MPIRRGDDASYALLENGSASGNAVPVKGGEYIVYFNGTIGGATVSLQSKSPNGVWSDVEVFTGQKVSYTTLPRSQTGVDLPAGDVRVAITGGSPSGIYAYLVGLG